MTSVLRSLVLAALVSIPVSAARAQTAAQAADADSTAMATNALQSRAQVVHDTANRASAYLDAGASELVRLARERRRVVDRSVEAYETTATERVSIRLRAARRDRILWQREVASRVSWQQNGPIRIEVKGAREVLPALIPNPQVPAGLDEYVPRLAFDPADPYLITGWGAGGGGLTQGVPHPLAPGSEANYRFRSGDSTTIRLADGRRIRLLELQVLPRRQAANLVRGSFWLDENSHAVVQATFQLAGEFDLDPGRDLLRLLRPATAKVEYVTIEYGLWDLKWWLPRIIAFRGAVQAGRMASAPFLYERTYTDYQVRGEPGTVALIAADESDYLLPGARARCPTRTTVAVPPPPFLQPSDVGDAPAAAGNSRSETRHDSMTEAERRACERIEVVVLADTAELLTSDGLPPFPFAEGEALLTEAELHSIQVQLAGIEPVVPWQFPDLSVAAPWDDPGLLRYNRVEGLSLGVRAGIDLGPLHATATARLGVADREPNGELSLLREGPRSRIHLTGFRRLAAMDEQARPFSLASSLSSLFFGRDEFSYYRLMGVELTRESPLSQSRGYSWRLFAQRERAAKKETDFSLAHLLDEQHLFPDNDLAQEAAQVGAALRLASGWKQGPLGTRTSAEFGVDGAVGSFHYARPSFTLRTGFPLSGRLVGLLEGGAGTSIGEPPLQHLWRIGGPITLRGYASGHMAGESFWRGRAEVATPFPAVRIALFSDAGWAGQFEHIDSDPWLLSGGVGISLLDGLIRLDLSRALKSPRGWSISAYLDAWQ